MRVSPYALFLVFGVALLAPVSVSYADPFHADEFVEGPTAPGKWGGTATGTPGGTVTWSLMGAGVDLTLEEGTPMSSVALSSFMPSGFLAAITAAFNAWSAVADIQFAMIADGGESFNADGTSGYIRIGGHTFDGPGGVLAHGYYPPANGNTAAGDIHFDSAELWTIGFGGSGFDIFQVMAHEIGHAIGLGHSAVANSLMNSGYTEAFSGPQADDIAGAQFLYGAPQSLSDPPADEEPPAFAPQAVPEPSTLLLLGGGVAVLVRLRRRAH